MFIEQLYVYPIKSLRGIPLKTAELTHYGFPYDRSFMLLREHAEGSKYHEKHGSRYENMAVSTYSAMCLFQPAFVSDLADSDSENTDSESDARSSESESSTLQLRITHTDPKTTMKTKTTIPLNPDPSNLPSLPINLHNSTTTALRMPSTHNDWFSLRFGFPVILAYIAPTNRRPVLGNIAPNSGPRNRAYHERIRKVAALEKQRQDAQSKSWLGSITSVLPSAPALFGGASEVSSSSSSSSSEYSDSNPHQAKTTDPAKRPYELSFADCSPYLLVSSASFAAVSARLPSPESSTLEIEKFRPNIVVGGEDATAWDEDFWAEIAVSSTSHLQQSPESRPKSNSHSRPTTKKTTNLQLTANCIRCTSLNVDYATGTFGTGPKGQVLKSLQGDRRVDQGKRFGPVFGRYAFLPFGVESGGGNEGADAGMDEGLQVRVGDEVEVTRRNEKRTVWRWPGSGVSAKDDLWPDVDTFS